MTNPQTVLVTGVGGYWGARLAAQLAADASLPRARHRCHTASKPYPRVGFHPG